MIYDSIKYWELKSVKYMKNQVSIRLAKYKCGEL